MLWRFQVVHTCFVFVSMLFRIFPLLFEVQWLRDYVHENERKISFRMVLRTPSGMAGGPSYDRLCVLIFCDILRLIFSALFFAHIYVCWQLCVNLNPPRKLLSPDTFVFEPRHVRAIPFHVRTQIFLSLKSFYFSSISVLHWFSAFTLLTCQKPKEFHRSTRQHGSPPALVRAFFS